MDQDNGTYWNKWASDFEAATYGNPNSMGHVRLRIAHDILGKYKKGTILDAGCGTGFTTTTFLKAGWKARGIDVSPAMVAGAADTLEKHGFSRDLAVVGSVTDLSQFPDQSFDAVYGCGVLYYVEQDHLAFREFHRVLKKGGVFIGSFYNALFDLFTFNRYTRNFFRNNFFPLSECAGGEALDKRLSELITHPEAPIRHDPGSARDDVFTRQENPLVFAEKLATFGFEMIGAPYYYRHHLAPPLIQREFPGLAEEADAKQYALRQDWRSLFMAAHFLIEARKA